MWKWCIYLQVSKCKYQDKKCSFVTPCIKFLQSMIIWYAEDVRSNKKRISPCLCLLSIDTEHGASKWYEWPNTNISNKPLAYLRMLSFELRSKEWVGKGRLSLSHMIWGIQPRCGWGGSKWCCKRQEASYTTDIWGQVQACGWASSFWPREIETVPIQTRNSFWESESEY